MYLSWEQIKAEKEAKRLQIVSKVPLVDYIEGLMKKTCSTTWQERLGIIQEKVETIQTENIRLKEKLTVTSKEEDNGQYSLFDS